MLNFPFIIRLQRGFTLVEMMVVVAIMAILLGVAAPSFQTFVANAKIRSVAENIQAGLMLAKSEALRRNENISFWLVDGLGATCARSSSGSTWVVSFDNPTEACGSTPSDTVNPRLIQTGPPISDTQGVTVAAVSSDAPAVAASCVTFNGFGRVLTNCTGGTTRMARVAISSTTQAATIRALDVRIDNGGGVRLCDPAKTGVAGC